MTRIDKYEVEGKGLGRCGVYTMITAKNLKYPHWGFNSLIADRGYKKGDIVEMEMSDSGSENWVKVNGKLIYERDESMERELQKNYITQTLKEKGIKHPVYNP